MSPEEMRVKAVDLFMKRFHCSQVVLAVGQEKLNMVNEEVVKALGLFGGGMAGTGRTCGALTGGLALISSVYSRGSLEGKEDPRMWSIGWKFIKKFEELSKEHDGTDCSDIAKMNWQDRDQVKDFYSNPESRRKICIKLVGDVAYALGELIEQEIQKTTLLPMA
jgi:C_GCAxxG_C_C family probable redox protein